MKKDSCNAQLIRRFVCGAERCYECGQPGLPSHLHHLHGHTQHLPCCNLYGECVVQTQILSRLFWITCSFLMLKLPNKLAEKGFTELFDVFQSWSSSQVMAGVMIVTLALTLATHLRLTNNREGICAQKMSWKDLSSLIKPIIPCSKDLKVMLRGGAWLGRKWKRSVLENIKKIQIFATLCTRLTEEMDRAELNIFEPT